MQAEVAFGLSKRWSRAAGVPGLAAAGGLGAGAVPAAAAAAAAVAGLVAGEAATGSADEQEDSEDDWEPLTWESERNFLPGDLEQVLGRLLGGTLVFEPKALFDRLPRFVGIKERADQNNHRGDRERQQDNVFKYLQQRVLSLLRVYALVHQHVNDQGKSLSQQLFELLVMLEMEVVKERKKASLPAVITSDEPPLISLEDLKTAEAQRDTSGSALPRGEVRSCLGCRPVVVVFLWLGFPP